jgi:hypothetical protein
MNPSTTDARDRLITLDPAHIDRLAWQPVPGCPGVRAKELWRRGDHVDALISYEAGASTPGSPHSAADHHIWVISGRATVAGQEAVAGSYAYVPPGVAHQVRDVAAGGCVLLQVHRRALAERPE